MGATLEPVGRKGTGVFMPLYASLTNQTCSKSPSARRSGKPSVQQDVNRSTPLTTSRPRNAKQRTRTSEGDTSAGSGSLSSSPGSYAGSPLLINFGSRAIFTHSSAAAAEAASGGSVGGGVRTPSHMSPVSPFTAGMQQAPFSAPVAQFTGFDTHSRADAASSISTAAPFQAQQQFMGQGVSAHDIGHTAVQASSAPLFGAYSSTVSGAMLQQEQPANLAQPLLPAVSAAVTVPPAAADIHFAGLSGSEPGNNALLLLQLHLQLQGAANLDPAVSMAMQSDGMPAFDGLESANAFGQGPWPSMFGGVSGDANNAAGTAGAASTASAALVPSSSQAPFLSAQQDLLQLQLPAASADPAVAANGSAMLPAAPTFVHALPATSAAQHAVSSDDDAGLDELAAMLDAQLQFLLAQREEVIVRRCMAAAFGAGMLV